MLPPKLSPEHGLIFLLRSESSPSAFSTPTSDLAQAGHSGRHPGCHCLSEHKFQLSRSLCNQLQAPRGRASSPSSLAQDEQIHAGPFVDAGAFPICPATSRGPQPWRPIRGFEGASEITPALPRGSDRTGLGYESGFGIFKMCSRD